MVLTLTLPLQEECKLRCYSADQIPVVWDIAESLIKKALDRGSNYTIDEVFQGLCDKKMQLWMWGDEAALVTSIQTKGGKTYCLLVTCGGTRMSDWFEYFPIVENWAKDEGAEEMRLYGRRAWIKITGYDIDYVRLSKKL